MGSDVWKGVHMPVPICVKHREFDCGCIYVFFSSAHVSAYRHVCIFTCYVVCIPVLATAEASIPGKGTTFGLISCLGVRDTLFPLAHQRRLECETEPDYSRRPPSRIGRFCHSAESSFVSERGCQAAMTASFCSGDFLFCPEQRVG